MKNKTTLIIAVISFLFSFTILTGIKTIAQEPSKEEVRNEFCERLKGSDGVCLLVEVITRNKSDEKSLTKDIENEVKEQLENSKIKILTKEESDAAPGLPRLSIHVITYKEPSQKDVFMYSFRIVHYEIASLLRTERYVEGTCWDSGLYIGMEKSSDITKAVKKQMNKYINDYLSVNTN